MRIIGIDPGKKGGFAWVDLGAQPGNGLMTISVMPDSIHDLAEVVLLMVASQPEGEPVAYLEKLHALPHHLRGSIATATLMENYGAIQGVLAAFKVRTILVLPSIWQREMGLLKKQKKDHKAEIQRRRPDMPWTVDNSDAGLLCEYGIRQERGER